MRTVLLRACLLACALATLGAPARAGSAVVTLKPHAEVAAREVSLADVAEIVADDAATADALARLRVGVASGTGRAVPLARSELARHVARHRPRDVSRVDWRGSETVQVQLRLARVDAQALVDAAAAALRTALEPAYAPVDVRVTSRPDALRLPDGAVSFATRLRPDVAARPRHRIRVEVDVHVDGRRVRTVPLWFAVQAHAPRWVARRNLPAGHPLAQQDFERRTVDAARSGGPDVDLPSEASAWRLRRPLRAGSALAASDLEDVPWISRHDDVTVEVRHAGVVVESRGTALADGRAGDVVPVRLTGADLVRGRVVGPNRLAL